MSQKTPLRKPFWEHVADLQRLLIIVAVVFFVNATVTHLFHKQIVDFLLKPLNSGTPLQFLSPLEPLFFILKIDFMGAILLTLPLMLVLAYRFFNPSPWYTIVTPLLIFGPSILLAIAGAAYSYYIIIPIVLRFMESLIMPGMVAAFTASGFVDFVLGTAFLLVLVFQIPILAVLAAKLQVFNPYEFRHYRRNVYLSIVIMTAVITPTTDVLTLLLVSLPAFTVTELGVVLGRFVYKEQS